LALGTPEPNRYDGAAYLPAVTAERRGSQHS
jgi:hypothetical protein